MSSAQRPRALGRTRATMVALAVTLLAGVILANSSAPVEAATVTISDPVLAACLTEALYAAPGTDFDPAELAVVETLRCGADGAVASLSGADHLTALTDLTILGSEIEDLSPLSGLSQLRSLSIESDELSDLSALGSLTQLEYLSIDAPSLGGLGSLSKLTRLTDLGVIAPVSSVAALSGLSGLRRLSISSDQLTDLSPLAPLTGLVSLQLKASAASDLDVLSSLTGLTSLALCSLQDGDLSPVANLTGLTSLQVDDSPLTNLAPLTRLTKLTYLDISATEVTDLTPLAGLRALTDVHLNRNKITTIAPLGSLTGLRVLSLDGNLISDVTPLASLVDLDSLTLVGNAVADVRPLSSLRNYYWLDLSANQISDLSPLAVPAGRDANRRLKADDQQILVVLAEANQAQLTLKGLNGALPDLTAPAGVTIGAGGLVTVAESGVYPIGFKMGSLDVSGYSYSGTVTVGPNAIIPTTPTILGSVSVGATLTAVAGRWVPAPVTLAYQWSRNGSPIAGATSDTYLIPAGDLGSHLGVTVTGSKAGLPTVSADSAPTAAVGAPALWPTPLPTISGNPVIGETLTATTSAWGPTPVELSYQWLRSGASIPGATSVTYVVQTVDAGKILAVEVTGTKAGYAAVAKTTACNKAVAEPAAFATAGTPTITGTARVGSQLTAKPGTWSPSGATFSYQWLRSGSAVAGATGATYQLGDADLGKTLSVQVTASKLAFNDTRRTSKATAKVARGSLAAAASKTDVTKPVVDRTIAAVTGTWGPAPVTFAYQWYRVSSSGHKTAIKGATKATYQVAGSLAGYRLRVRVSGSKAGYTPVTKYSKTTSKVAKASFAVLEAPAVTVDAGSPREGKLVTVDPGSFTGPASISYQWYRGSTPISKATGVTYRLTAADRNRSIKARVQLRHAGYRTATAYGVMAGTVSPGLTSVAPHLSDDTPQAGQVLALTSETSALKWGPQPLNVGHRWYANGKEIAGATQATYTVEATDVGKVISVAVSASAPDFAPVTRFSAGSSPVAG